MTEDWRSDQIAKDHEDFVAEQVAARRARRSGVTVVVEEKEITRKSSSEVFHSRYS